MALGNGIGIPFSKNAASAGTSYLLDDLSATPDVIISPSKAFRLTWETAPIIRLRRKNDGAESDFTGADITSGADLTWVGSQSSWVRYVYDQSGNSKHLGQSTAAYQGQYTDTSGNKITMTDGNPAPQQIPTGMTFPALGFTGISGAAVFRFNGNTDTAWHLLRNGAAHLAQALGRDSASPVSGVGTPHIDINGTQLSGATYTKGHFQSATESTDVTVIFRDIDWSDSANWNTIVPYLTYYGNVKMSSVALYNADPGSGDLNLIVTAFETT